MFEPPLSTMRSARRGALDQSSETVQCLLTADMRKTRMYRLHPLGCLARPALFCETAVLVLHLLLVVLLTACVSAPPTATGVAPASTGALLGVRLLTRQDPPKVLTLELGGERLEQAVLIRGRLQSALPGQFADYLIPIAVPPGRFSLKSLSDGNTPPVAVLNLPFEVVAASPSYLGRLTVRLLNDRRPSDDLAIEDAYDDDTLAFRVAVPEIRRAEIRRDLLSLNQKTSPASPGANAPVTLTWVTRGEAPKPAPALDSNTARPVARPGELGVTPFDGNTVRQLPEPARGGFARFLQLPIPRAFAMADTGAYGVASGREASNAALQQCKRQAGGAPCSLIAVDQTLVTALPRRSPLLD